MIIADRLSYILGFDKAMIFLDYSNYIQLWFRGFENNANSLNYQTSELQNDHRKPVLTVHLYTDGLLQPVYHQPPTRADVSWLNDELFNFVLGHVSSS